MRNWLLTSDAMITAALLRKAKQLSFSDSIIFSYFVANLQIEQQILHRKLTVSVPLSFVGTVV